MAKYCEEIIKEIEELLSVGVSNKSCAEVVGIPEKTFYAWMKKSKFCKRVKRAKAKGQVELLKTIDEATELNWQAAAWKLERIWPDEFGRKIQLQGDKDKPIAHCIPDAFKETL